MGHGRYGERMTSRTPQQATTDDWAALAGIRPLHARVAEYLRQGLRRGVYPLNRPLPPSRVLADQLGVSRTTVQTALQQLVDERLVVSRPRSGMYPVAATVAEEPPVTPVDWNQLFYKVATPVPQIVEPDHSRYPFPFLSGQIEQAAFPTRSWLKAVNQAMSGKNLRVSLGDPRDGDDPELVKALIEEVLALRGVHAGPDEVMITVGTQQGLSLLSRALLGPGVRVAMENPGYVDAQHTFAGAGAQMQYMTIDEFGASPKGAVGAHVVYLTPSSHHPTSVALSPQRRRRFLSLADEQDAVIIEDDYDAEIRLQGPPLAPMKSVDRSGRVVYLGTFSKYLAPGLRMGYVVAEPELIAQLRRFRHYATKAPSPMLQRSLALFIRSGDYARQLRGYRVRARSKFDHFAEAVGEHLPEFADQLTVPQMNMWLRMPGGGDAGDGEDAAAWAQRARSRGVLVTPGALYYAPGTVARTDELRVGLASIPEMRIAAGVRELGEAQTSS
ncbi:GntR family transcriptional regulator [Corynebacterium terpenotabidum Y-11]|uniref:GntR family transcriptional regulator n=2 Tax=Corynebacterium terpenotabidum TaxID=89154 RepID=S4XEN4_9CORY|nr:GntR family transcriptional regulator [Corynebacterium terpenotabidum Y-11]